MVDHHTLIDGFWKWHGEEMLGRKYCPVNWKWVIVSNVHLPGYCRIVILDDLFI